MKLLEEIVDYKVRKVDLYIPLKDQKRKSSGSQSNILFPGDSKLYANTNRNPKRRATLAKPGRIT